MSVHDRKKAAALPVTGKRTQSKGEELANTLSHGLGAAMALVGSGYLMTRAVDSGSPRAIVSILAYAISLVLLYTASAVYHGVKDPVWKARLQICDHCSIFLLILGTYIPMAMLVIGGSAGTFLCVANTVLALVGIVLNAIDLKRFARLSLVLYGLMGWLVVLAIKPLVLALPAGGLALLAGGGVAYTVGIIFYKAKGPYMHFIWHLFVLLGSVLQFFCIAQYAL